MHFKLNIYALFNRCTVKYLLSLFVITSCATCIIACEDEEANLETIELIKKIEADLYIHEIAQPFSRIDYPHVYKDWGDDWMDNINTMLPLAAMKVTAQPDCNTVRSLHLSAKSIEGVKPIIVVTCENSERFMVSLGDVMNEKRIFPLSKLYNQAPIDLINKCLSEISDDFLYPDSMVNLDAETIFQQILPKKTIKVTIPFQVKTGFDTIIKHVIECNIDREIVSVQFIAR